MRIRTAIVVLGIIGIATSAALAQQPCDARVNREQPCFTPYDSKPVLRSATAVQAAIVRAYREHAKIDTVAVTARFFVLIDSAGVVRNTVLVESSGLEALDQAARGIVVDMSFQPARLGARATGVWVNIPIAFCSPCSRAGSRTP